MRSRILTGVGAWLLGAVTATAGSLYTVNQLASGILTQHSKQVSVAMVNAELALEDSKPAVTTPAQTKAAAQSPDRRHHNRKSTPAPTHSTAPGRLLTSAEGSVVARCQLGGAYLIIWSPQSGFEAEHVVRGPSPVARVVFRGSSGGIVMDVSCVNSAPVEHVSPIHWIDDRTRHDE